MSLRAINREPSREYSEEKSFLYHKQNSVSRSSTERLHIHHHHDHGDRRFQRPRGRLGLMSPIRFLKHIAGEIARALCMVSAKRKPSRRGNSNNSNKSYLSARSKPFVAPLDSHREEAIEDCIQFINSSSTFSRSNSTTNTTS